MHAPRHLHLDASGVNASGGGSSMHTPARVYVHVHPLTPEELEHAPSRACARGMCIA